MLLWPSDVLYIKFIEISICYYRVSLKIRPTLKIRPSRTLMGLVNISPTPKISPSWGAWLGHTIITNPQLLDGKQNPAQPPHPSHRSLGSPAPDACMTGSREERDL